MNKKLLLLVIPAAIVTYLVAGLLVASLTSKQCIPVQLATRPHDDWRVFQSTPRRVNFFCLPEPPTVIAGSRNLSGPQPVPPPGSWQFQIVQICKGWPLYWPYFAFSSKERRYCLGMRWDNVDHYYVLSTAGHRHVDVPPTQPWSDLKILFTGIILLAVVVALFFWKVRAWLQRSLTWHPSSIVAAPILLTLLDLYFRGFTDFKTPLAVLCVWLCILSLLEVARKARTLTQSEVLAILLLWLPFDFHMYGGNFVTGKSDWPVAAVSLSILMILYWRDFRHLPGMKVNLQFSRRDLLVFGKTFAVMAVVLIPLALATGFVHLQPDASVYRILSWRFVGTFIAIALAIALGEELVFRGIIQNLLDRTVRSSLVSLMLGALLFGAMYLHKSAQGSWPPSQWNWRYMGLATLAGVGYGYVFRRTKSIIFPILLHASVDSVWHTLFR